MFFLSRCLAVLAWSLAFHTEVSTYMDLSGNCTFHPDTKYKGIVANCSDKGLTSVPSHLPGNTTTLLLRHNKIHHIPSKTFHEVPKLRELDLSSNGPISLVEDSFSGLLTLEVLMLNHSFDDAGLSNPLVKDYPDKSLAVLKSLKELYINGLQNDFGLGFRNLTNLRVLSLSSDNCGIVQLRNTTFTNVPSVTHLNLSYCKIQDTEQLTFSPLDNIHTIDVSYNRYLGFQTFGKATYGLRNSPIRALYLNNIYPEFGACSQIQSKDFINLQNTSLTHLHIDGNGITEFHLGVISNLPKTLECLSMRENRFAFGLYMFELPGMQSLKFIDISLLNAWRKIPSPISMEGMLNSPITILVPPKLETIIAEKCYITGVFHKCQLAENRLRKIVANHNLLSSITGIINGIDGIEYYDFSHNQLLRLPHDFFPENNSAIFLNLAHNYLGKEVEADINGSLLNHLENIRHVDLSSNLIDVLPVTFFKGLKAVEKIKINDNYLEHFDVRFDHLSDLKLIDLSNNKLKRVSNHALSNLTHLEKTKINLQGNPLLCSCQDVHFLKWIKHYNHRIQNLSLTDCELPNGTFVFMNNLQNILEILKSECQTSDNKDAVTSSIITGFCCLFIIFIVSFSLAYRHRWKIRYFYHIAKRRYWITSNLRNCEEQFTYDLFVSYAEKDRDIVIQKMIVNLENNAGLKMCIHHRDFLPGDVISTNIVNAIDKSKKTLIVLSPAFLQSDWCVYEFQIALQARVSRRQNNLLILLYEHVPVRDLPRDLAALLSTNCYLEYNPDVYGEEDFWRNLVEAIKTVQPLE